LLFSQEEQQQQKLETKH